MSKKTETAIYVIKYGSLNPEYVGFAIDNDKKKIKKKIKKTKIYN